MRMVLKLRSEHWQAMHHHVSADAPLEACGLLAGRRNQVESVLAIRNVAQSPVRFRMDPQEQFEAFEWIESNELALVGIYHSHPSGPETVSVSDLEEAAYEVVQIIWSRSKEDWSAHGYWIENGQAAEVILQIDKNQ